MQLYTSAALLGAATLAAVAPAQAAFIYAPGAQYETTEGNGNNVVVNTNADSRVQWFFRPAIFGSAPVLINAVSFRFDSIYTNQNGNAGTWNFDNRFRVTLNTLGGPVSTTFAENIQGGQTVLSGAQSISYTIGAGAGQTKPFGVTLTFATPYLYTPSQGLLVFDWFVPQQAPFGTFDFVQGANPFAVDATTPAFRLFDQNAAATTGSIQSFAPVARFDVSAVTAPVPEPAIWAMMIVGFGLVGGAMRTRERRRVPA